VWGHAARNRSLNVLARLAAGLAQEVVRRHNHEGQDNLGDDVEEGIGADLQDKTGDKGNMSRRCIHQMFQAFERQGVKCHWSLGVA
jgi:hypothetical protein